MAAQELPKLVIIQPDVTELPVSRDPGECRIVVNDFFSFDVSAITKTPSTVIISGVHESPGGRKPPPGMKIVDESPSGHWTRTVYVCFFWLIFHVCSWM